MGRYYSVNGFTERAECGITFTSPSFYIIREANFTLGEQANILLMQRLSRSQHHVYSKFFPGIDSDVFNISAPIVT
jgi:hypothetical protein